MEKDVGPYILVTRDDEGDYEVSIHDSYLEAQYAHISLLLVNWKNDSMGPFPSNFDDLVEKYYTHNPKQKYVIQLIDLDE